MPLHVRNQLLRMVLLWAVFFLTCRAQKKFQMVLQPNDLQDLIKQADICSKQAGFPPTALKKIVKWPISNARASKELFQCVCYNTGYTDEEGHMVEGKFKALKLKSGTKEEMVEMVKECNKVTLEDPIETAYAVSDCLHASSIFAVEKKDQ